MGAPLRLLGISHTRTAPVLISAAEGDAPPRRYTLTDAEYNALGAPLVGDLLSEEVADRLREYDAHHRARAAGRRKQCPDGGILPGAEYPSGHLGQQGGVHAQTEGQQNQAGVDQGLAGQRQETGSIIYEINADIADEEKYLKEYINQKDKLYRKLRARNQ